MANKNYMTKHGDLHIPLHLFYISALQRQITQTIVNIYTEELSGVQYLDTYVYDEMFLPVV